MQRVHEDDLSGFLLDRETRLNYNHICIPATIDGEVKPKKLENFYDENGLFWEERFGKDVLDDYKKVTR